MVPIGALDEGATRPLDMRKPLFYNNSVSSNSPKSGPVNPQIMTEAIQHQGNIGTI
jgi:hypothetical protein